MDVSIAVLVSLFLLLQPWTTVASAGDLIAPILAPIFEDVCKEVKCGQGNCKPSNKSAFPFECECLPGWRQLATSGDDDDDDDDNQSWKFLPCVIPNCTLNYSCSNAPSRGQQNESRGNGSIFDACRWTDCGGGKCVSTSTSPFTRNCQCSEGYYNLLNQTSFPCIQECSLGSECKNLGFGLMDPPPPPPSLSSDRSSQASYRLEGRYDWLIFTFALMVI